MRDQGGPFTIRHTSGDPVAPATVGASGGDPMRAFIVEVTATVVVRSDADPEDLPADVYSRIAEHIHDDDDILTLEVQAMPLPPNLSGQGAH